MTNRRILLAAVLVSFVVAGHDAVTGASSPTTIDVRVDPGELEWVQVDAGFRAALAGAPPAGVPGAWDLPLVPVTVLPPAGLRLDAVAVLDVETVPVVPPGPVAIVPLPDGSRASAGAPPQTDLVVVGPGGYLRGDRVDGLSIAPLRLREDGGWELVTRITLAPRLERDDTEDVVRPRRGSPRVPPADRIGGRVVDLAPRNASSLSMAAAPSAGATAGEAAFHPRSNPSLDGSPVEYVIVTSEAMAAEYQRLADWKTRSGTPAVVRTVEWVRDNYPGGADLADKIRSFIKDAVTSWGTEWVVLGGGASVIPVRYGRTTYYGGEKIPTDLYYQCLDGNWNKNGNAEFGEGGGKDAADLLPDVWVGRLTSHDVAEARVAIDKILTYEISPPVDADYPASALMLAEVIAPQNWNPSDPVSYDGAILSEETVALLPEDWKIKRLYENAGKFEGAEVETITTVLAEINRGYGLLHHVGHGYYNNMAVGRGGRSIYIAQADELVNGDRASVLYAINCTSAAIDFDCIAEHFMLNPNGGSLSCVGATRFDFPGTSHFYDLEFYRLIFHAENGTPNGTERIGEAAARAKLPFVPLSQGDNSHRWTQFTLIYLGDPHMDFWTARPTPLTVTHAASTPLGEQAIAVTVRDAGAPLAGARVTLFKDGECYASALTDAAGAVTLTARPLTAGTMRITAVSGNHLPYLADITVTGATGGYLSGAGTAIDDTGLSPANGNGLLESGERARVEFTIRNRGNATVSGITVSAEVEGSAVTLGALPGGPASLAAGAEGVYPFEAVAALSTPDLTAARVTLVAQADQGSWTIPAVVHVGAPSLSMYSLDLRETAGDGDQIPEAGETVALTPKLINRGTGATLPLTAALSILESWGATILDGATTFPVVEPESARAAGEATPFLVQLGASANLPRLQITVSDAAGERFTSALDIAKPAIPAPGNARGSESSITVSWTASTSTDVARYVVYRASAAAGPYERISGFENNPFVYYVDEPLPGLAVRYYRVAAQDSSGNISAPSLVMRGAAGLPMAEGFPLAALQGTQASPLVTDLDGDGVLEAITGREQMYAFHGDGTEVRDGDQDARTLGVWAHRPAVREGYWASPTVGDLDGDGRLELVGLSKAEGELLVWDSAGRPLPGWPRPVWSGEVPRISTPVLADVTGDGLPEIFFQGIRGLWGFDRSGNELRDGDNDPATHGIFFKSEGVYSYGSVSAADLNGDGRAELIFGTRLDGAPSAGVNMGRIHVIGFDGNPLAGWPVAVKGGITSSPAIGDVDGDGTLDVVIATGTDSVEVRGRDGKTLPGWPRWAYVQNQDLMPSPALGDVDNNGSLEIAMVSGNGTLNLWHGNGTSFPGFPLDFPNELGQLMAARGSPSMANLDEDDDLEIVWGNRTGWIFAVNKDKTYVDGFPLKVDTPMDGGILVADLDGDGFNEVVASGFDPAIYVYRSSGRVTSNPGWPMFRHDPRRTGYVATPIREAAQPRLALGLLQGPQLPEVLSVTVVSTKKLNGTPAVTVDGTALAVSAVDAERRYYRAGVTLTAGTHQVVATGTDVGGATGRTERTVDALGSPSVRGWLEARATGVSVWAGGLEGWPSLLLVQRAPDGAGSDEGVPPGGGLRVQVGPSGASAPAGTQIRFEVPATWGGAQAAWWDGGAWRPVTLCAWDSGRATLPATRFGWYRLVETSTPVVEPRPALAVSPAAPNPVVGSTRITFALSGEARVRAEVFDVSGRMVRELADGVFPEGEHALVWNGVDDAGRATASGIFFVRVSAGESRAVQRIVRMSEGGAR